VTKLKSLLDPIISVHLKPFIKKIDQDAYYPVNFLYALGAAEQFESYSLQKEFVYFREIELIEETAKHCMTSAFILWCHLAALISVRQSDNQNIKIGLLPLLETGKLIGGTGLSNALKFYAGLEPIRIKAERTNGGYILSGVLPSVSNLDRGHWFVIMAEIDKSSRIMCILPVNTNRLKLMGRKDYVGLNGSATFSCIFNEVFVEDKWILTEEADLFIEEIRPILALYQIPLGLGVTYASISSIKNSNHIDNHEINENRLEEIIREYQSIREKSYEFAKVSEIKSITKKILLNRLNVVQLTTNAVHSEMVNIGGQAYLKDSDTFRRLRESYFLVNLSPTLKQLEQIK
jgi:hypothetical protein